jgi:hypothetical protein
MDSPRVGLGRGVVYGVVSLDVNIRVAAQFRFLSQFYNIEGKILATAAQEGVVRGARSNSKNPLLGVLAKNNL